MFAWPAYVHNTSSAETHHKFRLKYRLQVAVRVSDNDSDRTTWRAGRRTVRRVDALEPSALIEVHTGPRNTRHYQEVRVARCAYHCRC